ncbi:MAG: NAD(P)/FAD-dependent oxidoreductase [Deltaproteobacteria bacterium]|nr:NAD(P)/FAD-dependent oxidoreductase [Deltaproteobacteria bacterium]
MADSVYDAVIIGGGAKGLITAMYLAKYGGMEVAVFEQKHEAGGGWCSDEGSVPGFVFDYHCVGVRPYYHFATERDFPEWKEDYGQMTRMLDIDTGIGAIFEDQSSILLYNLLEDPDQERSAKSIARFSQKDADSWRRLMELYNLFAPAFVEWVHNPPLAPEETDILDRLSKDSRFDPSWPGKSLFEVLNDQFESKELISLLLRGALSGGRPAHLPGMGVVQLMWTLGIALQGAYVNHGAHNMAHAAVKIFLANGGKMFTRHPVDKVIIENGKATGIRLTDGTEVKARKLVLSTLDPYSLCFRLTGKEYFDPQMLSRIEKLERRYTVIDYFHWSLNEKPNYLAADANPDINKTDCVFLITKDPEATIRETHLRLSGVLPTDLNLAVFAFGADKLRYPEGKFAATTEQFTVAGNVLNEDQWNEHAKAHAQEVVKHWQR